MPSTANTTVLLTGASGFLALHILVSLLEHNYNVVATVRSKAKGDLVLKVAKDYLGSNVDVESRVTISYIADNAAPGAYDEALKSHKEIKYAIHTASPFFLQVDDYVRDMLTPAVQGAVNLLNAVKQYGPQITHVVLTSSIVAMVDLSNAKKGDLFTEKDWNEASNERASKEKGPVAYGASKSRAEKAFWDFIEKESPNFTGTTVLPVYIYGPMLGEVKSADALNESNKLVYKALTGNLPQSIKGGEVDVRDVAEAHVLALTKQEAVGKRIFVRHGNFTFKDIVEIARKANIPGYETSKLAAPDASIDSDQIKKDSYQIDDSESLKILGDGFKYRSFEESIADTIKSLVAHGITP